VESLILAQDER